MQLDPSKNLSGFLCHRGMKDPLEHFLTVHGSNTGALLLHNPPCSLQHWPPLCHPKSVVQTVAILLVCWNEPKFAPLMLKPPFWGPGLPCFSRALTVWRWLQALQQQSTALSAMRNGLVASMVSHLCHGFRAWLSSLFHAQYHCNCSHGAFVPVYASVNNERKILIIFFLSIWGADDCKGFNLMTSWYPQWIPEALAFKPGLEKSMQSQRKQLRILCSREFE